MADPECSSVESVISNDDLLTEILVRLPLLSLVLFKSVSKRWLSLIKHANDTFRPKLGPPSGLFLPKYSYTCDFLPLDNRIPLLAATNFTFGPEVQDVQIWDSCNGLLLCGTSSRKFYVCNPSITNMFNLLPQPHNVAFEFNFFIGGPKLAFDPTKSPHYKVIYAQIVAPERVQLHTFSSETGNWSLSGHHFPEHSFHLFGLVGVYWNDAIYWSYYGGMIFKLDVMNEHPVLTSVTLDKKLHGSYSLFESRGCLLLVGKDIGSSRHTIYEKGNVHSEWSLKYIVNLERSSMNDTIVCIVMGEREEDSFIVWRLGTKAVQHKIYPKKKHEIVSKTLSTTISDLGPNDRLIRCFQFIPSFANV